MNMIAIEMTREDLSIRCGLLTADETLAYMKADHTDASVMRTAQKTGAAYVGPMIRARQDDQG